jgi:hypothetical protein
MPSPISGLVSLLLISLACTGCGSWSWQRRPAAGGGWDQADRQDPALSGNGRLLASIVDQGGRPTLLLQEQPSGRRIRLRQLGGHQPHSSPSLSWNGRYVALLIQQGSRRLAVVEDRANGRLQRLPLPGDLEPERISLAPDGQRLAMELLRNGRRQVQLFDLAGVLEPDRPGGLAASGGGLPERP